MAGGFACAEKLALSGVVAEGGRSSLNIGLCEKETARPPHKKLRKASLQRERGKGRNGGE